MDAAAALPVPTPDSLALKDPKDFTLIGTPAKRLDTPDKVNGRAEFGIDTKQPGMKVAAIAISPVFGGKPKSLDEAAARAVKGVRQVVRIDEAVAVVADHMGAAKKGLAAAAIQWDDGPNAKVEQRGHRPPARGGVKAARRGGTQRGRYREGAGQCGAAAGGRLSAPVPRPCGDGADELHRPSPQGWLRHLGRHPGTDPDPDHGCSSSPACRRMRSRSTIICSAAASADGWMSTARVLAVKIAQQVDGPVKVVWSREEDIQHDMYRPYYYDRLSAGLDAEGKPVAWTHRISGSSVMARYDPPLFKNGLDPDAVSRGGRTALCLPEHSCRLRPGRAAGNSDRLLARRWPDPQCLRRRKLH